MNKVTRVTGILVILLCVAWMGIAHAERDYTFLPDGEWRSNTVTKTDRYAYFEFTVSQVSHITLEVKTYGSGVSFSLQTADGKSIANRNTGSVGSPENTYTASLADYLNPGGYRVTFGYLMDDAVFDVRVILRPISVMEIEPNDTTKQAMPIGLNQKVTAVSARFDYDFYKVVLNQTRGIFVDINPRDMYGDCALYDEKLQYITGVKNDDEDSWTALRSVLKPGVYYILCTNYSAGPYDITLKTYEHLTSLKLPEKVTVNAGKTITLTPVTMPSNHAEKLTWRTLGVSADVNQAGVVSGIRPGKNKITVSSESGLTASCTVNVLPPSAKSIALPKKASLTKGNKYIMNLTVTPRDAQPSLNWKSSAPAVAAVNKKTGVITAKKVGKAVITAKTKDGKLSSKCSITVVENKFSQSKPLSGSKKGIYTSTKRLYYKGGVLHAEVFIYNKTGYTISAIDNLYFLLYDLRESDYEIYEAYIGRWKPKGGKLRNKSYGTFTIKMPKGKFKGLDLGSGATQATIEADFYVKAASTKSSKKIRVIPMFSKYKPGPYKRVRK